MGQANAPGGGRCKMRRRGERGTPVNRLSRSAPGNGIREEVFKLYSGNSGISMSLEVGAGRN